METHPHLKEFSLAWKRLSTSGVVPRGDVLQCLICTIGSFRFLEKLSLIWDERMLHWEEWKGTLLAAAKQNESLEEMRVDGVGADDFQGLLNFYTLRNRVNRTLESSARGLWGDMLLQMHKWPERDVGLSNVFLAFKTHPKLSEAAGRSRSTKRPRAEEEEDTDKSPE